jgi:phosphate:Na+ symporter
MGSIAVLGLLGGVALLLWGLRMVRSGITRAFGSELRRLLSGALSNRFLALSTGRGISSLWGVQFSPLGGLAISRFLDQRLRFSAVDHDA